LLIFVAYLNYLTDSYLMFAASALAANTVCRSACGAAAPLFTQYMFDALGVGGGGSLIGGVATLLAPIPFVFFWYGEPIRKRSKFAPTDDDEKEKEIPREQRVRDEEAGSEGSLSDDGTEVGDTYSKEGEGIDRVARPDDVNRVDVGPLDRAPRGRDPEKDLEKGEQ